MWIAVEALSDHSSILVKSNISERWWIYMRIAVPSVQKFLRWEVLRLNKT